MIYNNRLFNTRKELKRYLGGTRKYNNALKKEKFITYTKKNQITNRLRTMEQQYTTLTKDINNVDNKDAIVYAYIKSRMNYKTSIADNVTEKEISEKLGIPLSTVKRSVSRLKAIRIL